MSIISIEKKIKKKGVVGRTEFGVLAHRGEKVAKGGERTAQPAVALDDGRDLLAPL